MSTSHERRLHKAGRFVHCCLSPSAVVRATAVLIALSGNLSLAFAQLQAPRLDLPGGDVYRNAVQYQSDGQRQPIETVQLTTDPRRPLDPRILAMPKAKQKLQVIQNRSQLVLTEAKVRRIAISDPAIIDIVQFSEKEISILGLGLGTTDLWLWFENQEEPLMYVLTCIRDPALEEQRRIDYGRIERRVALLYPNSKVYLIPMSQKIIVRGQAADPQEAANILQIVRGEVIAQEGDLYGYGRGGNGFVGGAGNDFGNGNNDNDIFSSLIVDELQVPGEFQIMIRVRIAELNRSQLRRLGVDWSVIFDEGAQSISQSLTGGAAVLTGIFEAGDIRVLVDALASNGSARILEDASLTVLSGEPAAFLSGGEFAVPSAVGIGGGQTTTFRGFGTSVICTPTVVDNDLVRLQIVPELSSINGGNAVGGIPGLNVKRVQTRVELREGQTIVLGGLFSRREEAEVTRIPFLGELPLIGNYIFNTKQATEDENELLIIVTPEIVRPMDADQVPPLPGFYVTHPDDVDFYKFNRIEGNPDLGHYHLLPYGNGHGVADDAGYNFFNPPQAGGLSPNMGVGYQQQGIYQGQPVYQGQPTYQGQPVYQSQPTYQNQPTMAPPSTYTPQPTLQPVPMEAASMRNQSTQGRVTTQPRVTPQPRIQQTSGRVDPRTQVYPR